MLLFPAIALGQQKYTLSGTVLEQASGESLIGVSILIPELSTGTTTNEYGFYSITVPEGTYEVTVSYLGFSDITETIDLSSNLRKDYRLEENLESLEEVVITADNDRLDVRKPQLSVNTV